MATFIVGMILVVLMFLAARHVYRNVITGKSDCAYCGGGCGGCGGSCGGSCSSCGTKL